MQRIRHIDSLQGFMNSFKQFEKKLDKLQSDVNYHGNTLTELRTMVANLSGLASADFKTDKPQRRTIGSQYDNSYRVRRFEAIQPLPNKIRAKSFQGQKHGFSKPAQQSFLQPKKVSLPAVNNKHHPRPRKAEAPRKATTLKSSAHRQQKPLEKSRRRK